MSEETKDIVWEEEFADAPVTETYGLPNFGAKSQLECDDMKAAMDTVEELKKRATNGK